MQVSAQQLCDVQRLCLKREALLVRIQEIERHIDDLLGAPFPYPKPRIVPQSFQKGIAQKVVKKSVATSKPFNLRKLNPDESHYEVRIRTEHGIAKEFHTDTKLLQCLLELPNEIQSINTIDTSGNSVTLYTVTKNHSHSPQ